MALEFFVRKRELFDCYWKSYISFAVVGVSPTTAVACVFTSDSKKKPCFCTCISPNIPYKFIRIGKIQFTESHFRASGLVLIFHAKRTDFQLNSK
jgi:hypothetical protein